MSKISDSRNIRPEAIREIMGEQDYQKFVREIASDTNYDGCDLPVRTVSVVIDGWHVRRRLSGSGADTSKQLLSDWIDRLGDWLAARHMDNAHGLSVDAVAWDSHLGKGKERTKAFQAFNNDRKATYLGSRSDNYVSQRTAWLAVDWNFSDLRQVGDFFVQSGVDARIATSIIAAALEKPNFLYVVTADRDFAPALKLASRLSSETRIIVLTVRDRVNDELSHACDECLQIFPGFIGKDFSAPVSSK